MHQNFRSIKNFKLKNKIKYFVCQVLLNTFFFIPRSNNNNHYCGGESQFRKRKNRREEKNWLVNGALTFSFFSSLNVFFVFVFVLHFWLPKEVRVGVSLQVTNTSSRDSLVMLFLTKKKYFFKHFQKRKREDRRKIANTKLFF